MAKDTKRWKEMSADFVATLVYLDEPQVVVLDHGEDSKIIGVAIEKDGFSYPFLGAEVSFTQLERYYRQFVDLRFLFLRPKWKRWFIFDLGKKDKNGKIALTVVKANDFLTEEYLPESGFFARDHTNDLPLTTEIGIQKFLIDGSWAPSDLSVFFGRINDLYSFFLGIAKFGATSTSDKQKRALVEAFTDNSLHSGFNYVNLFSDLKDLLGFDERLAMGAIEKHSPGYVDIEGKPAPLNQLNAALDHFVENYEGLKSQYNAFHSYLSRLNLLKAANLERFDKTGATAKYIRDMNQNFAQALEIDPKPLEKLTSNHSLLVAKILLSYWRRLDRYYQFFLEGRVRLEQDNKAVVI
jgi:hypothetical protein